MQCPSHDYLKPGEKISDNCRQPVQWYHHNCSGKSEIYDDITLRCSKCEANSHLKNWKFFCNKENEFKEITQLSFNNALTALLMSSVSDSFDFDLKSKMALLIAGIYNKKW
ncbi:hypothetical protein ABPG72_002639 [Tetrahymena utriculariae]